VCDETELEPPDDAEPEESEPEPEESEPEPDEPDDEEPVEAASSPSLSLLPDELLLTSL